MALVAKCKTIEQIMEQSKTWGLDLEDPYIKRSLLIWEESFSGQEVEIQRVKQKEGSPNIYVIKNKKCIPNAVTKGWLEDAWITEEDFPYEENVSMEEWSKALHCEERTMSPEEQAEAEKLQKQFELMNNLQQQPGNEDGVINI